MQLRVIVYQSVIFSGFINCLSIIIVKEDVPTKYTNFKQVKIIISFHSLKNRPRPPQCLRCIILRNGEELFSLNKKQTLRSAWICVEWSKCFKLRSVLFFIHLEETMKIKWPQKTTMTTLYIYVLTLQTTRPQSRKKPPKP